MHRFGFCWIAGSIHDGAIGLKLVLGRGYVLGLQRGE